MPIPEAFPARMKRSIAFAWLCIAMIPIAASGQPCKAGSFTGAVSSKEPTPILLHQGLIFDWSLSKDDSGWVISISGEDMSEDWTYPVTFPIRTGEQQVIGTGYGSTVQQKMTYPIVANFVLTHADFVEYSAMADETLASPRAEAAKEFIHKVDNLQKGQVTIKASSMGRAILQRRSDG